ncbi:substrate-binding domain-containing protein [Microbacterium sp. nov. GSS16]|uniref:substrate-binding domain-containing protein n=1 Tax=Microbacterium sp. nov. GSS16 TaxID=3019890 RepID=UPI0023058B1D|nr:substrate-binding domain-containing protein [Microbacterium sp. nov. GSS16]WCD93299.1 substrate-binding domain-containing protein [Microbacterium sp. nov. GSS16]
MVKPTRFRRYAATAVAFVALGVLTLAGCSAPAGGDQNAGNGASPAAGSCGAVPQVGANDPDGLLDDLSAEIKDGYNGYPFELQKSAWADWKSEKTDGFTAAIVGQAPAAPFIAVYQETLAKALEDAGVDVILNVAPNDPTDVPGQLQQFGQAISLKPDIIFFNPAAPEPAIDLVDEAHDAGIPVVSVVVPIDSPNAISVTYNAVLQSMTTASGVFESIGGSGSVLEVTGVPGIPNQAFWDAGRDYALAECPEIDVVGSVQGLFQPPLAQQAVVQYLASNPAGVDAVIQAGTMGWAIRDAFAQAGQPVPPIQDVGASQGMAAYAAANPDYPYFGTATPPIAMAKMAAQVGVKVLAGAGPKLNHVVWAPYVVNDDNLAEVVDDSWSESDGTDLAPDGVYFTDEQTAEFFTNPANGPQSAN